MRFLIVDDSSTMRRILVNTLTKLGYETFVEATNGREALERLGETDVDVILTDANMPVMSGLDLVRHVRSEPATRDIPIVMVTINAGKEDIMEALRAGANSYVVKPFTQETIREQLDAILRQRPGSATPGPPGGGHSKHPLSARGAASL